MLNNELYVGTLVWNRLRYVKDPETKRRHSRANTDEQIVRAEVSDWRIVDDTLWFAVKDRQAGLDASAAVRGQGRFLEAATADVPAVRAALLRHVRRRDGDDQRDPSRLLECPQQGRGRVRQPAHRQADYVEDKVLGALAHHMMPPDIYAAFVRGFMAEWNVEQKGRAVEQDAMRDELKRINQKIDNFVSADRTERRLVRHHLCPQGRGGAQGLMEAEMATAEAPAPRLMPNLAELYREKVAGFRKRWQGMTRRLRARRCGR